jgi:DNA mismatch endonuclease (patch repair protein)
VKVAVYVDGCFWHGCPEHGSIPKSNVEWWREKIARVRRRDTQTNATLRNEGWEVIRLWEHEQTTRAADRVESVLNARRRR